MKPSTQAVRDWLLREGSLTPLQALRELGVYRLGARIYELRESGLRIETTYLTRNGKRYAKYLYYSSQGAA